MQRPAVHPRRQLRVRSLRLDPRGLVQREECSHLTVERLDAREGRLREFDAGDFAGAECGGGLFDRQWERHRLGLGVRGCQRGE